MALPEPLIAIPTEVAPLTHLRGALISNSLQVLREHALLDRYFTHLPRSFHEQIRAITPAMWAPVSLGEVHYTACDQLGLSAREQFDFGYGASARIHGSLLATLAKLSTNAGVTPWTGFTHYDKLWSRSFRGAAAAVTRLGPKEARVDIVGFPLAKYGYIRHAFRGVNQAGIELFCRRAYVRELTLGLTPTTFSIKFSWA